MTSKKKKKKIINSFFPLNTSAQVFNYQPNDDPFCFIFVIYCEIWGEKVFVRKGLKLIKEIKFSKKINIIVIVLSRAKGLSSYKCNWRIFLLQDEIETIRQKIYYTTFLLVSNFFLILLLYSYLIFILILFIYTFSSCQF